ALVEHLANGESVIIEQTLGGAAHVGGVVVLHRANEILPGPLLRPEGDAGAEHLNDGKARVFDGLDDGFRQVYRLTAEAAGDKIGASGKGNHQGLEGIDSRALGSEVT